MLERKKKARMNEVKREPRLIPYLGLHHPAEGTGVQTSSTYWFICFGYVPMSGMTESYGDSVFNVFKTC